MDTLAPTTRTRIKRAHQRGSYDRETINTILDAGLICHVGYVFDGHPYVTATSYWREGDRVYWHGSSASRMLRQVRQGVPVCVTVSHFDGLVLARSGFHRSLNYRSVMLFGTAEQVTGTEAKLAALEFFTERLCPGRWPELRPASLQQIRATTIVSLPIAEGAATESPRSRRIAARQVRNR